MSDALSGADLFKLGRQFESELERKLFFGADGSTSTASELPARSLTAEDIRRAWQRIEDTKPFLIGRESAIDRLLEAYSVAINEDLHDVSIRFRVRPHEEAPEHRVIVLYGSPKVEWFIIDVEGWTR